MLADPKDVASNYKLLAEMLQRMSLFLARLYGPAARCKPKMMIWRRLVLRFCIRPIDGALRLLAIMDNPRAFDLIRVSAAKAVWAT